MENDYAVIGIASPRVTLTNNDFWNNRLMFHICGNEFFDETWEIHRNDFLPGLNAAAADLEIQGSCKGFTVNAQDNWWDTTDSVSIEQRILHQYDDPAKTWVNWDPPSSAPNTEWTPAVPSPSPTDTTSDPGLRCPGLEHLDANHIVGTDSSDFLEGTEGDDVICGLGHNDTLWGAGGDDLIVGGSGHDSIRGGDGNDLILGSGGNDEVIGDSGNDKLFGGGGNDVVRGRGGIDIVRGGSGGDYLIGGGGNDSLSGGAGRDSLNGGAGIDRCRGGRDRDRLKSCER